MLFILLLIILLVSNSNAETIIVDCHGSGDFATIQEEFRKWKEALR